MKLIQLALLMHLGRTAWAGQTVSLANRHTRILQQGGCATVLQDTVRPEACACEPQGGELLVTCRDVCEECRSDTCMSYSLEEKRYLEISGGYAVTFYKRVYEHQSGGTTITTEFTELEDFTCQVVVNGVPCNSCEITFGCDDINALFYADCTNIAGVTADYDECDATTNAQLGPSSPFYARINLDLGLCPVSSGSNPSPTTSPVTVVVTQPPTNRPTATPTLTPTPMPTNRPTTAPTPAPTLVLTEPGSSPTPIPVADTPTTVFSTPVPTRSPPEPETSTQLPSTFDSDVPGSSGVELSGAPSLQIVELATSTPTTETNMASDVPTVFTVPPDDSLTDPQLNATSGPTPVPAMVPTSANSRRSVLSSVLFGGAVVAVALTTSFM